MGSWVGANGGACKWRIKATADTPAGPSVHCCVDTTTGDIGPAAYGWGRHPSQTLSSKAILPRHRARRYYVDCVIPPRRLSLEAVAKNAAKVSILDSDKRLILLQNRVRFSRLIENKSRIPSFPIFWRFLYFGERVCLAGPAQETGLCAANSSA